MKPLNIFIGMDQVESVAWHTLAHSIMSLASVPVSITPVFRRNLDGIYTRKRDPQQSNEFSFTRFLVPFLSRYEGWALFMDCDMLVRTDIKELFDLADPDKAVMVVKHDYTPHDKVKYLGNTQYDYPRKNWSSVVLWNCAHPKNAEITPELVNTMAPSYLHRFLWLEDNEIGELPLAWNWLVGEYPIGHKGVELEDIKNWHWTNYGPWLREFHHVDGAEEWFETKMLMQHATQNVDVGHIVPSDR